jgi:mRNA-degrading endonuclease RelE of RelBE toxin-antitoxin system
VLTLLIPPPVAQTIRHLPPGVKRGVKQALRAIAEDPAAGEPLQRELASYLKYKVRRFRIVYSVDHRARTVRVLAVGARATIYEEVAEQLRRRRDEAEDV